MKPSLLIAKHRTLAAPSGLMLGRACGDLWSIFASSSLASFTQYNIATPETSPGVLRGASCTH
jgi:hypothetical protein